MNRPIRPPVNADGTKLTPKNQTIEVLEGKVIGYMGNTGASAERKPIAVHEYFEQIDTDGPVDFSNGWTFSSKTYAPRRRHRR